MVLANGNRPWGIYPNLRGLLERPSASLEWISFVTLHLCTVLFDLVCMHTFWISVFVVGKVSLFLKRGLNFRGYDHKLNNKFFYFCYGVTAIGGAGVAFGIFLACWPSIDPKKRTEFLVAIDEFWMDEYGNYPIFLGSHFVTLFEKS